MASRVDFPAPDEPSMATMLPRSTCRLTPASTSGAALEYRYETSTIASPSALTQTPAQASQDQASILLGRLWPDHLAHRALLPRNAHPRPSLLRLPRHQRWKELRQARQDLRRTRQSQDCLPRLRALHREAESPGRPAHMSCLEQPEDQALAAQRRFRSPPLRARPRARRPQLVGCALFEDQDPRSRRTRYPPHGRAEGQSTLERDFPPPGVPQR